MDGQSLTKDQLDSHFNHLVRRVFNPGNDYPQFEAMLNAIRDWSASLLPRASILVLERAYIYGGTCFFAPLFSRCQVTAVDCQIASTKDRYGFNKHFAEHDDVIRWKPDIEGPIWKLPVADGVFDHLICPNVVHHVKDQERMFSEWARALKPGGTGFVFEALVRELHQVPDDYLRYTPFGFQSQLERVGLRVRSWSPTTDIYDVIRYCFVQAFPYFPEADKATTEGWARQELFPRLEEWSLRYKTHLKNPAKSFPTGFFMVFEKPGQV